MHGDLIAALPGTIQYRENSTDIMYTSDFAPRCRRSPVVGRGFPRILILPGQGRGFESLRWLCVSSFWGRGRKGKDGEECQGREEQTSDSCGSFPRQTTVPRGISHGTWMSCKNGMCRVEAPNVVTYQMGALRGGGVDAEERELDITLEQDHSTVTSIHCRKTNSGLAPQQGWTSCSHLCFIVRGREQKPVDDGGRTRAVETIASPMWVRPP